MAQRGYTVITYAKDAKERTRNIVFVEKLRALLDVRCQIGKQEKIVSEFDKNVSRWINSSKGTVLIFTPSFASNTWKQIFNRGRFTYDARTKAKKRLIPVIMPPFQRKDLDRIFGVGRHVRVHDPVVFGPNWEEERAMLELVNIIKDTKCIDPLGEQINLVEFSTCMTYAIRNRTPPELFTNDYLQEIAVATTTERTSYDSRARPTTTADDTSAVNDSRPNDASPTPDDTNDGKLN
ncbi:hypothetical protein LSAT2_032193, partial [Lamellibrachia satsuma]